jgi:N-acyl-L-homoserine lactone synthetase
MVAVAYASQTGFSDRVASLLDNVDYRIAVTEADREAIFRLRYEAYLREGAISPNFSRKFSDAFDETDNVWLFGVYIDDVLAGSMRLHVATRDYPVLPGLKVFSDFLEPELQAGKIVLDPTRFVTDHALSRLYPALPYAILRLCWMAAEYFRADHFLATVRAEHQAFYRRVFQHRTICPPRPYPSLSKPICLMSVYYPDVADQVHRRYPFFRSTLFERRALFERFVPMERVPLQPMPGIVPAAANDMEARPG